MPDNSILPIVKNLPAPDLESAKGGVLADFWHGIIGDRVAKWRLTNAARLGEELAKECAERGLAINPKKLPERFAYSWFEKATQEDEPELQTLFATLIANAAEGNEEALNRRNIDLLSRMAPKDAALLDYVASLYKEHIRKTTILRSEFSLSYKLLISGYRNSQNPTLEPETIDSLAAIGVLRTETVISFDNRRLDIMHRPVPQPAFPDLNYCLKKELTVQLTQVGESLINALELHSDRETKKP